MGHKDENQRWVQHGPEWRLADKCREIEDRCCRWRNQAHAQIRGDDRRELDGIDACMLHHRHQERGRQQDITDILHEHADHDQKDVGAIAPNTSAQ